MSSSVVPLNEPGTNRPSLSSPRAAISCLSSNRQRSPKEKRQNTHEPLDILVTRPRADDLERSELHLQHELVDLLALLCEPSSAPEGNTARDVRGVVPVFRSRVDEEERARSSGGERSSVIDVVKRSGRRASCNDRGVGLPFGAAKGSACETARERRTHPFLRQYPVNVASASFSSVASPFAIALISSSCAALVISLALRIH